MNDNLSAAHDYLRHGWGVVPLHGVTEDGCRCRAGRTCPPKNRGKHPSLGKAWHERALTSGPDVQAWFDDHPHDNLGVLTGPESGIFVFDVDGAPGVASLVALTTEHGAFPPTRIVRTGSGGLHYYFRHPGHFTVHGSTSWLGKGIDIRGAGGQVVAPPSVSGLGPYEVIADADVAEAPGWLLELLREHAEHIEQGRRAEVVGAERVEVEGIPEHLTTLLSNLVGVDEGRHKHFHAIVAAAHEAGYTQGQAVSIVAPWCAAVGKFVGRVEQEVARSWNKLTAAKARAEEWLPGVTGAPVADAADYSPRGEAESAPDQPTEAPATDDGEAVGDLPSTWAPVDLEAILDGTYEPERPELFVRTDGAALLYPGRVHSFHGESESGKSLIAQAECARLLIDGGRVAFIDFESDAGAVVGRLLELGAAADMLRAGFEYRRPDSDPRRFPHERAEWLALLAEPWDLVVIDGMTDALGVWGAGSNDNDEIAAFMRAFPRTIARRTGAAVVVVDHVTKDADSRGRFAVGGQAKMNALDGAAYTVEVVEALGRGLAGLVVMWVAKDRPGGVRPYCGKFRRDRTQEAARVLIDSSAGDGIKVTVGPPEGHVSDPDRPRRDTWRMERISELLETEDLSGRQLAKELGTTRSALALALTTLETEGFIGDNGQPVKSPTRKFVSLRAYRQAEDPASDEYLGGAVWSPTGLLASTGQEVANQTSKSTGQPAPLPEGGAGPVADQYGPATGSGAQGPSDDPDLLVSCVACFRPTTAIVAGRHGGRCYMCARKAGLVEGPS